MSSIPGAASPGIFQYRTTLVTGVAGSPVDKLTIPIPFSRWRLIGSPAADVECHGAIASFLMKNADLGGNTGAFNLYTGPGGTGIALFGSSGGGTDITLTTPFAGRVKSLPASYLGGVTPQTATTVYLRQTVDNNFAETLTVVLVFQQLP